MPQLRPTYKTGIVCGLPLTCQNGRFVCNIAPAFTLSILATRSCQPHTPSTKAPHHAAPYHWQRVLLTRTIPANPPTPLHRCGTVARCGGWPTLRLYAPCRARRTGGARHHQRVACGGLARMPPTAGHLGPTAGQPPGGPTATHRGGIAYPRGGHSPPTGRVAPPYRGTGPILRPRTPESAPARGPTGPLVGPLTLAPEGALVGPPALAPSHYFSRTLSKLSRQKHENDTRARLRILRQRFIGL